MCNDILVGWEFHENQHSEIHVFFIGTKINFRPYVPHLLSDLAEICVRDMHIVLLSLFEFSLKSALRKPYFSFGCKRNHIFVCTINLYDILQVKNALEKSAYCITDYTFCSLFYAPSSPPRISASVISRPSLSLLKYQRGATVLFHPPARPIIILSGLLGPCSRAASARSP